MILHDTDIIQNVCIHRRYALAVGIQDIVANVNMIIFKHMRIYIWRLQLTPFPA